MPYRIVKRGDNDYRVLEVSNGRQVGKHESSEDAAAQIRAIYLSEHKREGDSQLPPRRGWAGLHRRGYGGG